jgi:type II secretory pathway pseudopilin PulG
MKMQDTEHRTQNTEYLSTGALAKMDRIRKGCMMKRKAFTIIELITVMSIIIILMSLLIPGLNMVRRYAYEVKQKNQFRSVGIGLEFYNAGFGKYPESGSPAGSLPLDGDNNLYCGAMRLAEALVGQDQLGLHPDTRFFQSGFAGPGETGEDLYPARRTDDIDIINASIEKRKELYIERNEAIITEAGQIYSGESLVPFFIRPDCISIPMLSDVYPTIEDKGMPVLYYKANQRNKNHNIDNPDDKDNIYNYLDNHPLLALGLPVEEPATVHPMFNEPKIFYEKTINRSLKISRPQRADTYILMSAGFDGLYGTKDDIFNF